MAFVTYEFPDFNFLIRSVIHRIKQLQTLDSVLGDIRDDFYKTEQEWFDSEGQGRWVALSERYARWKNRLYPGKTILRRSDHMYEALTGQPGNHSIQQGSLRIYVRNADYWRKHQLGDPRTRLPIREVLSPMIEVRKMVWNQWVSEWIARREGQRVMPRQD